MGVLKMFGCLESVCPSNSIIELDGNKQKGDQILADTILSTYEIERDDQALRDNPQLFEQLRGDYPVRREFGSSVSDLTAIVSFRQTK